MRAGPFAALAVALVGLVLAVGCDRAFPPPGPVPLRGAAHMRSYLSGAPAWMDRGDDGPDQFWSFAPDGTCRTWVIPGEDDPGPPAVSGLPDLPAGTTMIIARWAATEAVLSLTQLRTEHGATLPDVDVPLRWIDGKLRIGIDGRQHMRVTGGQAGTAAP
ncbi:MAG: hypothetical protein ACYTJ0_13790 [Planctomycetota bacterium]|jgi:hypothetical protein